ncbi:hypothetical protein EVAR_27878_1 [Eumeta japonica]|uniref:Uncharacterized protein n=1 Tax=Eumeta variegata TaxID=151549 RepID=A0A4C1UW76_EUMVA|nr:hypothetical protein EVAR_27878_1 [Eumeta japonica]
MFADGGGGTDRSRMMRARRRRQFGPADSSDSRRAARFGPAARSFLYFFLSIGIPYEIASRDGYSLLKPCSTYSFYFRWSRSGLRLLTPAPCELAADDDRGTDSSKCSHVNSPMIRLKPSTYGECTWCGGGGDQRGGSQPGVGSGAEAAQRPPHAAHGALAHIAPRSPRRNHIARRRCRCLDRFDAVTACIATQASIITVILRQRQLKAGIVVSSLSSRSRCTALNNDIEMQSIETRWRSFLQNIFDKVKYR